MKSFIVLTVIVAFALSASTSFAAYNGARNYESKPAAAKASPASVSNFASKSGKGGKSGNSSGFKSGGFKAGRR